MDRRLAGAVLVAAVLLGSAVVARLVNPGMPGDAAIPAARALQVGDCVVELNRRSYPVECATRHTAEVVAVIDFQQATDLVRSGYLFRICDRAAAEYLGVDGTAETTDDQSWQTSLLSVSTTISPRARYGAPPPQRACLLRPAVIGASAGYTGTVRGVSATGTLPEDLRPCFVDDPPLLRGAGDARCTELHNGEVVGIREVTIAYTGAGSPATDPRYLTACRELAAERLDVADPTYDGRLRITLVAQQVGFVLSDGTRISLSGGSGAPVTGRKVHSVVFDLTCSVRVTGAQRLTGSVLGLGAAALPLT